MPLEDHRVPVEALPLRGLNGGQPVVIKIYTHENRLILFNIRNLLQAEGIETTVRNEFSSSAVGDLSPFETWPELWLLRDEDLPRAQRILARVTGEKEGYFEA